MTKRTRFLFALTAALLVFVMLFSAFYIAAEAGHDCAGEDCRICRQIAVCRNTLNALGLAAAAAGIVFLAASSVRDDAACAANAGRYTLVSLKVKLSD